MKYIAIALMLCAIPAAAFAQDVSCNDCDHVAPYFKGNGGFIGTVADGADKVTFVAFCGSVSTTGEAQVHGATATQLFNHRNGLACDRDGGFLEIAGLEDGGWFWITDEMNSAVGSLVNMDVLGNMKTAPTSAGDGVTMSEGNGAVFVKELSTGRVGILPTILPEAPQDRPAICGPRYVASAEAYTDQQTSSCTLGDGGTKIRLLGRGQYGGNVHLSSRTVTREHSVGGQDITAMADLWVNESGSYSTADPATPALGWVGKGESNWLPNVAWGASLAGSAPGADISTAGVAIADTDSNGQAEITVSPSSSYCPTTPGSTQRTAVVNIVAGLASATGTTTAGAGANNLHPDLAADSRSGLHASTQLTVLCPPRAAANQ